MSVEDKVVVVAARRTLTAMWMDITLINFRCTRGVLYVGGHLQRMTASHSELYLPALREMDLRLHKIHDVHDVKYRFDNWRRNIDGGWSREAELTSLTFEIEESLPDARA